MHIRTKTLPKKTSKWTKVITDKTENSSPLHFASRSWHQGLRELD